MFYSSNACKNKNIKNCFKIVVHHWLFVYLITLNERLTCGKIQLCTHNQRWDLDILKSDCYCLLCFIALIHVKIKILKDTWKLKYMIDYLLFNNTKWDVNLLKNSIMYSKPKLRYGHFKMQQVLYTVYYNSNICINRNFQNSLKIAVHDWLFVV